MNKIIAFLIVLYLVFFAGGWWLLSGTMRTAEDAKIALGITQNNLATKEAELAAQKTENEALKKIIADARAYASFLSLALCPLLEATNKEAPCIKNNTEWFAQMIESGTVLPDQEAREKMTALIMSLTGKTKPTAKQLYETLKPIEVRALKMLTETLR